MAIEVEQERLYREYNNYSLLSTIRSMTTFITKSQIIIHSFIHSLPNALIWLHSKARKRDDHYECFPLKNSKQVCC